MTCFSIFEMTLRMMGSKIERTCNRHSPKLGELMFLLTNDGAGNQDVAWPNGHSFLKPYVFH